MGARKRRVFFHIFQFISSRIFFILNTMRICFDDDMQNAMGLFIMLDVLQCWLGMMRKNAGDGCCVCASRRRRECWIEGYLIFLGFGFWTCKDVLHASHGHGLHMTHSVLLEEHLKGLSMAQKSGGLVNGSEIRGIELDRGSGSLRGGVGSRGSLVLLGDLEESHVCSVLYM